MIRLLLENGADINIPDQIDQNGEQKIINN